MHSEVKTSFEKSLMHVKCAVFGTDIYILYLVVISGTSSIEYQYIVHLANGPVMCRLPGCCF